MERNHAVALDSAWHLRQYKETCKQYNIHVAIPVKKPVFPHYQVLTCSGNHIYSLYNDSLVGTPTSIYEMGYVLHAFSDYKSVINNFFKKEEMLHVVKEE